MSVARHERPYIYILEISKSELVYFAQKANKKCNKHNLAMRVCQYINKYNLIYDTATTEKTTSYDCRQIKVFMQALETSPLGTF